MTDETLPPVRTPLEFLQELCEQQFEVEQDVERLDTELKEAKNKLVGIAEHQIPELMDDLDLKELKLGSGLKIKVDTKVHAKKLTNPLALATLVKLGESGMIKSDLTIAFGKSEEKVSNKLMAELLVAGLQVKRDEHVNHMTLGSWLQKQREDGADIDLELYGAHEKRTAKVSLPK